MKREQLDRARFALARAVMRVAELVAPVSVSGTAERTDTDRTTAVLLAVGTDVIEVGAALISAGERVPDEYRKAGL